MPTLASPLKDILTDAADPVDLTALPEDEAIAQIKGIYGFLASEVEVAIHNGVAVITLPDVKASKTGQAFDKIGQATRAARGPARRSRACSCSACSTWAFRLPFPRRIRRFRWGRRMRRHWRCMR